VHADAPPQLVRQIADLAKVSTGQPSVFHDEVIVAALQAGGVTHGDARDFAIVGCYEPVPAGKANSWTVGGNVFLPKCLQLAMNGGFCPDTGRQVGPATPARGAMTCFDDLLQSFYAQVSHGIQLVVQARELFWSQAAESQSRPFESALRQDCLARGRDLCAGGARYNAMCCCAIGLANAADGLAALRQCVFQEKRFALDSDRDVENLGAMIRTYFGLGGQHLMFNVVDVDTLRQAQQDPGSHGDLLVRISGLSAYFVHLDAALQDDIIARTEREL
jgi:pyruvate-formate lyase